MNRWRIASAALLGLLAAGCGGTAPAPDAISPAIKQRLDALSERIAALEAAKSAAPGYTLTVTWTNFNQPPSTTQTAVPDAKSCDDARQQTLQEGARLRSEADAKIAADSQQGILSNPSVPQVTAVCSSR